MKTLKELQEELKKFLTDARDLCDLVDKEKRDFTPEERQKVAGLLEDAKKKKGEIKTIQDDDAMRKSIIDLGEGIEIRGGGAPGGNGNGNGKPKGARFLSNPEYDTLGEAFIQSKAWQDWMKQVAPGGHIADSRKGISSPPLEFKNFGLFRKDLVTGASATSAGAFLAPEDTGIYEPLGRYQLTLRDLISVRTTTGDTVEFVRQTAQITQAAPVAESNVTEKSGYPGEVSGEKPEGTMMFERVSEAVKTIAAWIPATKRAISDVGQLRGLIDQELREDLAEELENQLLNGNGIGENFTGLANTANVLVQAFDTDIITTTRKAITNLLVNGKQVPTAWLIHPTDWETIDLQQDLQGRYYWGGPQAQGVRTLWGYPVAQSFLQTPGTGWLGNWRKMVLWDREQANISVSDSHADFFIRNMIAILAELRAAMGVIRPTAFVEVDLSGGS
jgi:HK97 family phage major capsid protein